VRNAHRRLQLFDRLGVDAERIHLVVNKYEKRKAHLSLADIRRNLGTAVAATVAFDPRTVEQAVNDGRLVREVNKRSPAALDYSNLVGLLTEGEVSSLAPTKAGLMSWLLN
jgi:Flp pilus assembly CpaE family ATPase